jgi:hypothetical protein
LQIGYVYFEPSVPAECNDRRIFLKRDRAGTSWTQSGREPIVPWTEIEDSGTLKVALPVEPAYDVEEMVLRPVRIADSGLTRALDKLDLFLVS